MSQTVTLEHLLVNLVTLRPKVGEVLVVTLPKDATKEAVAAAVGSLKANAGTYPCPVMVVTEGTQAFTHEDMVRPGDKLAISTELLEDIHGQPEHCSQVVVCREVRHDAQGVKTILVANLPDASDSASSPAGPGPVKSSESGQS